MVERYTVNVIDTTGDEPSIKRSNSYKDQRKAINAVETLSHFVNFETERIELGGGDSIRAWLDSMEESEQRRTDHVWTPDVGEVMNDPDAPHWSSGDVRITEITDIPANEYELEWADFATGMNRERTVARENPGCPEDDPVVLGNYVNGSDKEYAFPVSRLDKT